jgi:AcrR family transcriptional regulator
VRALKNEKRPYRLGKRAEQQAETRRRIVEAAVALHGEIGPAATTMTMLAERAGVQRHTLYAHFPDERSLLMACSGLFMERNPLPDPEPWRGLSGEARLRSGFEALYAWYGRNAAVNGCVLRDAEIHDGVREVAELRMAPPFGAIREVLGEGLDAGQLAMLGLMMSFFSWRSLVRDEGLRPAEAASLAADAVLGATALTRARPSPRRTASAR